MFPSQLRSFHLSCYFPYSVEFWVLSFELFAFVFSFSPFTLLLMFNIYPAPFLF